jgi:hypothetical protein
LALSVRTSRHTPEQLVVLPPHETVHTPAVQAVPAPQTRAQLPQLELSVLRSRHTPEQLVCPAAHETTHTPAAQA